jgi:hypothetical protein
MEMQNRRMLADMTAWAEILDAFGWNVALRRPAISGSDRHGYPGGSY